MRDYKGDVCNGDNSDGHLGAWPDVLHFGVRICVHDCAQTLNDTRMVTPGQKNSQKPGYTSKPCQFIHTITLDVNVFHMLCAPVCAVCAVCCVLCVCVCVVCCVLCVCVCVLYVLCVVCVVCVCVWCVWCVCGVLCVCDVCV